MIVTNKNQARWYKEISFRALPEQNVKQRGEAKEPEELAVK